MGVTFRTAFCLSALLVVSTGSYMMQDEREETAPITWTTIVEASTPVNVAPGADVTGVRAAVTDESAPGPVAEESRLPHAGDVAPQDVAPQDVATAQQAPELP